MLAEEKKETGTVVDIYLLITCTRIHHLQNLNRASGQERMPPTKHHMSAL
jgi:hypothetical protein